MLRSRRMEMVDGVKMTPFIDENDKGNFHQQKYFFFYDNGNKTSYLLAFNSERKEAEPLLFIERSLL